jgi:hypothetical protein
MVITSDTKGEDHTVAQDSEGPGKRPPWWKRLWGWTEFGNKTGWQWLELLSALAIPVVLAVAGFWFTAEQAARQREIETRRAEAERALEDQRAQDASLQAYLDQMTDLTLNRGLRDSEPGDTVYELAQARTLTVMSQLGSENNMSVTGFLTDAGLLGTGSPSIGLLRETDLQKLDLRVAALDGADFQQTIFLEVDLTLAMLDGADFGEASLFDTDFTEAHLRDAYFDRSMIYGTDFGGADLKRAAFDYAVLGPDASTQYLIEDVEEQGLDFSAADFTDAHLQGADFTGSVGVTEEQLHEQARSLKGAIMPDGQKYEDWLENRKGNEDDGKNGGSS